MQVPVIAARTGPRPARLKVRPPASRMLDIELCFNPTQLKTGRSNTFAELAIPGLATPPLQYIRGGGETLSVELLADTTDSGGDVRTRYTDGILALMDQDPLLRAPPIVEFHWDRGLFTGVVEKVDVTFELFDPDGVPLRASVSLSLKAFRTVAEQTLEMTSGVSSTYLVQAGDTLSGIAGQLLGDPKSWRKLASENGIADPRKLAAGHVLQIPSALETGLGGLF